MSLTGTVLTILPVGAPSLTPAGQLVYGPGDVQEPAIVGTYTFIGDGTITTVPVNFIDGTQGIPFTPKAILAFVIPAISGTQDSTGVMKVEGGNGTAARVTGITTTSFNVVYSTAVANLSTASFLFVVYR